MELINSHCHSKYCGHGEGEVSEYVAVAKAAGITTLTFTEHFPLSQSFDPNKYLSVTPDNMPKYVSAVEEARAKEKDIEIILGTELDYLSDTEDRNISQSDLNKFELILCSVHFVDGWAFDDPAQRDVWEEEGEADRIWKRYIDIWCEMASDKTLHFDVLSHPDLAKKFNYYPSFDLSDEYKKMAEAAHAGNRRVEVNTSGAYYACAEMFPSLSLLKEFCAAGIPCTVGTDAHTPANIARDIEKAYKLMYDAGYRELSVPTRAREWRKVPIS